MRHEPDVEQLTFAAAPTVSLQSVEAEHEPIQPAPHVPVQPREFAQVATHESPQENAQVLPPEQAQSPGVHRHPPVEQPSGGTSGTIVSSTRTSGPGGESMRTSATSDGETSNASSSAGASGRSALTSIAERSSTSSELPSLDAMSSGATSSIPIDGCRIAHAAEAASRIAKAPRMITGAPRHFGP